MADVADEAPSCRTSAPEPEKQQTSQPKSRAFKLAFASLCACSFISILDTVIIAPALPVIAHALDASSVDAYWTGSGFLLAQAVSQPIYGALSEIFGRKACLLFALGLFTLASVFCATAQSITWLIVARVFQGAGGGGSNALVLMIVADMVSLRERAKYIGILSLGSAVGLVAGIVMGSVMAERASWRLIFYINLPICIPALAGIYFFVNLEKDKSSFLVKLRQVDWTGMIILTGSLISLLFGITSGGVLHPWVSASTLTALIIGPIGIVAFLIYESRFTADPMIPIRIFSNRTAISAILTGFMMGLVLWAMEYYLILYFLVSRHQSLLGAAVSILPGCAIVPPFAAAGGFLIGHTKHFRTINSVAWAFVVVGFSLMTLLTPKSNKGMQYGFQVVYSIGGGILFPGRLAAMQASQQDKDVPMATALNSFFGSLGQAFGVGIGGTIFQNEWDRLTMQDLAKGLIPAQYAVSKVHAEQSASLITTFPMAVQVVYREIMAKVIANLFIALAAFSGVAFLGSLASKNLSMDRDSKSRQAFVEKGSDRDATRRLAGDLEEG